MRPAWWALVLAAGESKRMGAPKLLLPFGGKTVIGSVVEKVVKAGISNILVVLGAEVEEVKGALTEYPVLFTVNEAFRRGMLSSVQAGFRALPGEAAAAFVILGDQPSLSSSVIQEMMSVYVRAAKGIVVPVFEGRRGHPLLLDVKKYRTSVESLDPAVGLRQLLQDFAPDVAEASVPDASVLHDIDTPEDYKRLKGRKSRP